MTVINTCCAAPAGTFCTSAGVVGVSVSDGLLGPSNVQRFWQVGDRGDSSLLGLPVSAVPQSTLVSGATALLV
jgi:hypothetical protein